MAEQDRPLSASPHRFCIAPMMAWTDRHARYFLRLISKNARLYTEMVPVNALLHGAPARFLKFDPSEHPVALQLGGSDPRSLGAAAKIGEDWGYDEINLNIGCPSDRVSSGNFGACLMAEPKLVAECVSAMSEACSIPITVKCRIGIDEMDIGKPLDEFVSGVMSSGSQTIIVHARKAWLKGLSPKENRRIPPLNYERVYDLKRSFPTGSIVINGGITTIDESLTHLTYVDGVMLGRAAYETPYILAGVDNLIFGASVYKPTRLEIINKLIPYCRDEITQGTRLHNITRHILGLFHGCHGARGWRRHLSTYAVKPGATESTIIDALEYVVPGQKAA
ncbi:MAG: tRNA dihydrouridine(20/20a) synthase DusA [Rhodospirillales bacterium]|jgi:tRNA-dihydrouridine synthase A